MSEPKPVQPLADQVIDAVRAATGRDSAVLHEPVFAGNEWSYLKECLDSTFVSYKGEFVERFEARLTAFTGARHAIAVVNGTAALHVALRLAGVEAGDEVLVPALCFVATANAVAYCGAVPHFVDCEPERLGIDAGKLEEHLSIHTTKRDGQCVNKGTGRPVRALVPMHVFGHPADMEALMAVARRYDLALIEDAAESLGSWFRERHTGTMGLMGTLSFNGNKTITTGGGGALLTDDDKIAERARHLTTTAKLGHPWEFRHDEIGYNYRLPSLNAALGCAQLEELPGFIKIKRRLYERYASAFSGISGISVVKEPENCRSNYWLQTLLLDESAAGERDAILEATNAAGLMTRPVWQPLNTLPPYRDCPAADLSRTRDLAGRLINVPSGAGLDSA